MFEILDGIKTVLGWIGWLGIGLIPTLACAAIVWFVPPIRKLAIAAGVLWVVAFSAYTYGDSNGADRVRDEWKAAEEHGIKTGEDDRTTSEQEIPPVVEEPVAKPDDPPAASPRKRLFRSDPYNRDNR